MMPSRIWRCSLSVRHIWSACGFRHSRHSGIALQCDRDYPYRDLLCCWWSARAGSHNARKTHSQPVTTRFVERNTALLFDRVCGVSWGNTSGFEGSWPMFFLSSAISNLVRRGIKWLVSKLASSEKPPFSLMYIESPPIVSYGQTVSLSVQFSVMLITL